MSREVTIVPSFISNLIWQVSAYYVASLLIEFQSLKCFQLKCSIHVMDILTRKSDFFLFCKQKTKDHLIEVKIETYKKQYFHLKDDFAYIEVSKSSQ